MSYCKQIDTIEHWLKAEVYLREHNYKIWQLQYGIDSPEGFHVCFKSKGFNDIEIFTFDREVQRAILEY